jgi:hypothetical protein
MKKIVYYTMSISLGLLVLIFLEGMMTLGSAFKFEEYSVFGWIMQAILVVFAMSLSAMIAEKEDK